MIASAPWLWIGLTVVLALVVVCGAVVFIARRIRAASGPHILIGSKRIALRGTVRLDRSFWRSVTGKYIADVGEDYAELFQTRDGSWEVQLRAGEFMFVDGRRSRHNRLRPGAVVTVGRTEQMAFRFFSRQVKDE